MPPRFQVPRPPPKAIDVAPVPDTLEKLSDRCSVRTVEEEHVENEAIVMSQDLYKPGSKLVNHLRTVGVITSALSQRLPERDIFEGVRYKSCAVIASAGILLQRNLGKWIDSHDAVLRFNSAHTKGRENYVGSRTTMRLVNRENFGWRELKEEYVLQHITTETLLKEYAARRMSQPTEHFYGIVPAFYKRVITSTNSHPTNGFFGIRLALELCDCVYLYGFVRNWLGYMTYHYHDDYTPKSSQAKRDSSEYPLIQGLIKEYPGRLVYAHPCIMEKACKGCPEGARCVDGVPTPVPAPGYCYGHGQPGGHPTLRHWTAREYWSGDNWTTASAGMGRRKLHSDAQGGRCHVDGLQHAINKLKKIVGAARHIHRRVIQHSVQPEALVEATVLEELFDEQRDLDAHARLAAHRVR
eukprot:gene6072-7294_t